MMDNATFHKKQSIQQVIINAGHMVEYLPAYSPDLNPFKHKWAQAKSKKERAVATQIFCSYTHGVIKIKSLSYMKKKVRPLFLLMKVVFHTMPHGLTAISQKVNGVLV